jgi:hydroxymethylpyrimidine pyrophosphatase-like HAD family hydrolase
LRFQILASDYDGTLARDGRVAASTLVALQGLRASGWKLILLTGRELEELRTVFLRMDLFDFVVAENGALLHVPTTGESLPLCADADRSFAQRLRDRGVPVSVGRCIIATVRPYDLVALEVIRESGLDLQVNYNKDAAMILPRDINKATGLSATLARLSMLESEVVGIGDAENDHAFLSRCGFSAAVSNAIPSLKERVNQVMPGEDGDGVVELIDQLIRKQ